MGIIIAQCRSRHIQWIKLCIHRQLHSMSVRMQLAKMDRKKSFHTLMTGQLFHEILPHKKCHNCSSLQPGPCHVSIPSGNRNLSSPPPTRSSLEPIFLPMKLSWREAKKKGRSSAPETERECCRVVLSSSFFFPPTHCSWIVRKPFEDLLEPVQGGGGKPAVQSEHHHQVQLWLMIGKNRVFRINKYQICICVK